MLNLKTLLPIIVITFIVIIGGFFAWQQFGTPKEEVEDETADWQTYRDEEYGFEIKYPLDWKYYKESAEDTVLIDFCGPKFWEEVGNCRMAGKGPAAAITLRNDSLDIKKADFCVKQPLNIFCGDILSHKNIQIEGRNGEIFEFNTNNGFVVALWKKNPNDERMYELQADELNDFSEHRNIFNQMLSTFRFINKNETADWKTYINEEYGFEFKYPANISINYEGKTEFILQPLKVDFNSFEVIVWDNPKKLGIKDYFLENSACAQNKSICEYFSQGYPLESVEIGSRSGWTTKVGTRSQFFVLLSPLGKKYSIIEFLNRWPDDVGKTEIFNQMLSTFKFLK